ncbi:phospholipase D-like domain-containing protein [Desulfobacterium sp. N47]|uniref:phospholipase D-like domain-containing protein n=1 Tax=Desulfobacterium sp. N47 TaxID=3115210 RepID=UPI003F4A4503
MQYPDASDRQHPGTDQQDSFYCVYVGHHFCRTFDSYAEFLFFPDDQIAKALTDAAKRGVDVKIILPGITDSQLALHAQRCYYSGLLKSGVKIYERNTSLLHAKTAVIDNVWSTVGSTNMDFLSLLNNDEVNAVILSKEFAAEMEKMFVKDLAHSRQIQWNEWEKRPLLPRVREWFVNLFVRWL